ncbi:hypothetical protein RJ640_014644 [Escallonia rubra]|uniref:Pectinesterase inhibitor domain-containing protein n=1 Tax=Escallonia rubra TaxID=112253 RepID=A0AA88RQ39_9ASTE|nr:hypothetical protein RJ640_014644 [Escallonia rubra]
MALLVPSSSLLISLLLVLLFIDPSVASPIANATGYALVARICEQTYNKYYCTDALKSDPRTKTADPKALLEVSLKLASSNATATTLQIQSLIKDAKDPGLKDHLQVCADVYKGIVDDLTKANTSSKSGQYDDVRRSAIRATHGPESCEVAFKEPPAHKTPLSTYNFYVELLSDIVVNIASIIKL